MTDSGSEQHDGHCLCGACRVRVDGPLGDLSACHCDMCTRWSGSVQMGFEVAADRLDVEGPIKRYRSSAIAERAWCDDCGSALWLSGPDMSVVEIVPGLFENAGGARLARIVYADRCPDGFALTGDDVQRVSASEYEASEPHVPD